MPCQAMSRLQAQDSVVQLGPAIAALDQELRLAGTDPQQTTRACMSRRRKSCEV